MMEFAAIVKDAGVSPMEVVIEPVNVMEQLNALLPNIIRVCRLK